MIIGFGCDDTALIFAGRRSRRFPPDIQPRALRKLRMLHAAGALSDVAVPPGNALEALRGERAGQHSIRINAQWRIVFRWTEGGADDVAIIDYHR